MLDPALVSPPPGVPAMTATTATTSRATTSTERPGSTTTDEARGTQSDAPLLAHMGHDPVDVDALCLRAGMSAEQVSSELLRLELDGRVAALPGGLYQRLEKGQR